MSKTVKISKVYRIKYSILKRVNHKNRFWANGAKKYENYGNSSFFRVPPFFPCKNYDSPVVNLL